MQSGRNDGPAGADGDAAREEVYDVMTEGFGEDSGEDGARLNWLTPGDPTPDRDDSADNDLARSLSLLADDDGPEPEDDPAGPSDADGSVAFDQESAAVESVTDGIGGEPGPFDVEVWEEREAAALRRADPNAGNPPPTGALQAIEDGDADETLDVAGLAPSKSLPRSSTASPPPIEVYVRPRVVPPGTFRRAASEPPSAELYVMDTPAGHADSAQWESRNEAEQQFHTAPRTSAQGDSDPNALPDLELDPGPEPDPGWRAMPPGPPPDGDHLREEPGAQEIDMSPVAPKEMTGIWLTTAKGVDSPVWLDGVPAEPEDLDVDAAIADRLRDWAEMWNAQWDPETGWLPRARIADYEALGAWLGRRVKDASGAVRVTVQLAHLGRSGIQSVGAPEVRTPVQVALMNDYGAPWPVWVAGGADLVTEYGVGSFSSEINARLEAWARDFARYMDSRAGWQAPELATRHAEEGHDLAQRMQEELGPDYSVELQLWEVAELL